MDNEITYDEIYELAQFATRKYNLETENILDEFKNCDNLTKLLTKYNDLKCTDSLSNDEVLLESISDAQREITNKWNNLFDELGRCRKTCRELLVEPIDEVGDEVVQTCFYRILKNPQYNKNDPKVKAVCDIFDRYHDKLALKTSILAFELYYILDDLSEKTTKDKKYWETIGNDFPIKLKLWKNSENIDPVKLVKGYNLLQKIKEVYTKKFSNLKDKQKDLISKINILTNKLATANDTLIPKIARTLAKMILKYSKSRSSEKLSFFARIMGRKYNNPNEKYGSRLALRLFSSQKKINDYNTIIILVKLAKLGYENSYKIATKLPGKKLKEAAIKAFDKAININKYKSDGKQGYRGPETSVKMMKVIKDAKPIDIENWYCSTLYDHTIT